MTTSGDRLARLLALVPYLLAHPGARVADVAQVFGITPNQLASDLKLIWFCGLPGYGPGDLIDVDFTGPDGTSEEDPLDDGTDDSGLPRWNPKTGTVTVRNADTIARPLRLTRDEAVALLVGLRMLADLPGVTSGEVIRRTVEKLRRAAGETLAPEDAERMIVTVDGEARWTAVVREALQVGRRLHLRYYVPGRDEVTERDVDPMRLLVQDGRVYLEGWCRLVGEVRLFLLDRVLAAEVLDAAAQVPATAVPRNVSDGLFQPAPEAPVVTLELEPGGRWVAEYHPCEEVDELPGGRLRVRLRTADARWARRLALLLGPHGRVVDPPELAAAVRADAQAALAAYEAPDPPER
ncbi:MAG: helix-turn-helix transcriptional regulator [Actinomycetota bacterium]